MNESSFERKFVGDTTLGEFALCWLDHVCLRHIDYADEVIHSIYYDTPGLHCFHEKVNGDFIKTKVRLRWYNEPGNASGGTFLEVKRKAGGSRSKRRVELDARHDRLRDADLDDPGFLALLAEQAGIGELPPCGLAPAVHISYRRNRFICPATRSGVALDTCIGVIRSNAALIPGMGCVSIPHIVLEIKGERRDEIPWMRKLYDAGFRSRSFSKYGQCVAGLIREEV